MTFMLEHAQTLSLLLAMGIGGATALAGWVLCRSVADIPPEDRKYKDPPPAVFRAFWWPIHWCSYVIAPLLPSQKTSGLRIRLRKAGLEYSVSAAQFLAARLLLSLLVAAAFLWVLDSFAHVRPDSVGFGPARYVQAALSGLLAGWAYPGVWLRDRVAMRRSALQKSLPFYLDIITLCVEAGLNLQGAIVQAVEKGPHGMLRDEFLRMLRDVRAGKGRAESLSAMGERLKEPSVVHFISAVIQAERMGMNLGPVLRAQADQRRSERFLRAEKLAMEAPVKLLFPLIAFIFPCTFIVLFFPIIMKLINIGL